MYEKYIINPFSSITQIQEYQDFSTSISFDCFCFFWLKNFITNSTSSVVSSLPYDEPISLKMGIFLPNYGVIITINNNHSSIPSSTWSTIKSHEMS